eukprot:1148790-Karenia_brevis.AAC.1
MATAPARTNWDTPVASTECRATQRWCKLVVPYLRAYDRATHAQGGRRNFSKTIVTIYAPDSQMAEQASEWRLAELGDLCTIARPADRGRTLGVGLGGPAARATEFRTKNQVVQRMHDRLRRMSSTGAELALAQACLGVAK